MPQARRSTSRQVALVWGGGDGVGRAVALALGGRGADVVVAGGEERALGGVVGELVCGGGKARHVAGKTGDVEHVAAAIEKAREAFGELTLVVVAAVQPSETTQILAHVRSRVGADVRLVAVGPTYGECDDLRFVGGAKPDAERWLDMVLFLASSDAGERSQRILAV